jgi:hypothetical protein
MQYFAVLGERVERAWRARNYDEAELPRIAEAELIADPPSLKLGAYDPLLWLVRARTAPTQLYFDPPFGEPAIQVYQNPRFYIEVLYWLDGSTSIHEHGFDGAFHVLAGSSVHALFQFDERSRPSARVRVGEVSLVKAELLKVGDTRTILPGSAMSHSLFHMERPSVTVVVRSRNSPGAQPQYNYLRPGLALDPFYKPEPLPRQIAAVQTLLRVDHPDLDAVLADMFREADAFTLARLALDIAQAQGGEARVLRLLEREDVRAGKQEVAAILPAVIREDRRLRWIKAMRSMLHAPTHRLLLALLINLPHGRAIIDLVAATHPTEDAATLLSSWIVEIAELIPTSATLGKLRDELRDVDFVRPMLCGTGLAEVLEQLRRTYGPGLVDARRDDIAQLHQDLQRSPLFGVLFC